ncbi:hypothetical protein M407DRAFT_141605 [Tulasnella calospora MUT 4182]|uniref:Acyl-CoA thioesterase-like C-terminal domain-containing protein n=1 Tax=Tulasnella calospora MUT 4182 TaxID=1051891 RepID=A0A0C3QSP9_9AGAM|nr:hypothetical protein M407DRAFT_141605 [Tulasnella calospora MUT 4182]
MASPPSTVELSIRGNVSDDVKNDIHHVMTGLVFEPTFAWSVGSKLRITDVDRLESSPGALVNGGPLETTTARVICELDVDQSMCDGEGVLHTGCIAFLMDLCTTLTYFLYDDWRTMHVSSTLNMSCHDQATTGGQLRIVSSSVTMDDGLGTSKCEIWEAKEGVLIASGSHTKMRPSASKL